MKVEDLGPQLYERASHRSMEIAMTPRDEYPEGVGLSRSVFTVQRSEPNNDEEAWPLMTTINPSGPDGAAQPGTAGACTNTWNPVYVGQLERQYGPETFSLVGPTVCQDELVIHWKSRDFWEKFFAAMEKRNVRSLENRLRNISMNFVPHAGVVTPFVFGDDISFNAVGLSKSTSVIVPPDQVYLGDLPAPVLSGGVITNYGELTQEVLDRTAAELIVEGATDPDSNGWITMGPSGPVWPLEIGLDASIRILQNNAEFRADLRFGYDAFAEANPLLKRVGASQVIKNFRHVVYPFVPRWDWVTKGTDGQNIGPNHLYTEPTSGHIFGAGTNAINTPYGNPAGCWVRRPVFKNYSTAKYVTKGFSPEVNPDWTNAYFEGTRVLSPWVYREEPLRPIGAMGSMSWRAQNYLGDWRFITGIEAFAGIDGCVIPTGGDPMHKQGRHFGEYKHASKPVFPRYGRLIVYARCEPGITITRCS